MEIMQNTTSQPQQFMTKPSMPSSAPDMSNQDNNRPQPKKLGLKSKKVFAVAGLVLFLIVAVMGVLIAQKQVAKQGEDVALVAPNAPESRPEAAIDPNNYCSMTFNVPKTEGICDTKEALTDFTGDEGSVKIPAGSEFNVGDQFVFSITVIQPTDGVAENVVVQDILPASLKFVSGPLYESGYTIAHDGQTVTANIPTMGASSAVKVEFKVEVVAGSYGDQTNLAQVLKAGSSSEQSSCTYNYTTLKGITECVSKEIYDNKGTLLSDGAALIRGEEYEYKINVKTTNRSLGKVKIHDLLPEELEFVEVSPESAKYVTSDPTTGLLTADFGQLMDEEMSISIIMRVPEEIGPTSFENIAFVYDFPEGSKQKEPPANADQCSVNNVILPDGTAECVSKEAYTDFEGTLIEEGSEINPNDEFVYRITLTSQKTTTGPVVVTDELPQGINFVEDPDNFTGVTENNGVVTVEIPQMTAGQEVVVEFKVQLVQSPTETVFNNTALVVTNGDDDNPHSCSLSLDLNRECNSECELNTDDCTDITGGDHICVETDEGNFCRLEDNENSLTCTPATPTPTPTGTPTPTPTGTPTPTPTPTPTLGCNDGCEVNADCSDSNHICVTTDDGTDRCRLEGYEEEENCVRPTPTPTPSPTPTPTLGCNDPCDTNADCSDIDHICVTTADGSDRCRLEGFEEQTNCVEPAQPTLPPVLPETGPEDWLNWLKAGLVTLGIGTALFLLL